MVALAAYFDESRNFDREHGHDHGIVAMAGYLGSVEMWENDFTPAWQRVLDAAPHRISEFKSADCRHRTGEFKGWSRAECDALTRELIGVITDPAYTFVGIGTAVLMQETKFTSSVKQQNREAFAYWACLSGVSRDAMNVAQYRLGDDHLQCVFDEERDLGHDAKEGFDQMRAYFPHLRHAARDPQFARSHEHAPLQAADLLAYETYKELRNRWDRRPPSKALVALVEGRPHQGYWVPLPYLLTCLALAQEGVEIPEARGHRIYDSAAPEKICRPHLQR